MVSRVVNVIGIGSAILGISLSLLVGYSSRALPPPADPSERDVTRPHHNVSAGEYVRTKWWHEEEVFRSSPSTEGKKVALITGGSSGIGRAVAAELCKLGVGKVAITSRSLGRAEKAAAELIAEGSCSSVQMEPLQLDLADFDNVRDFATEFKTNHDRLHYFVQNAGGVIVPDGTYRGNYVTKTGHEYSYGGNYLGHFLLLNLLLDLVRSSSPARIAVTSSIANWGATRNLTSILPSGHNAMRSLEENPMIAVFQQYCNTKLLQVIMCFELQRRLGNDSKITVTPLAPGFVNTNIGSNNRDGQMLANPVAVSPLKGAGTTLHALLSPSMEGKTGFFLQPYWSPLHLRNPDFPLGWVASILPWEVFFQRTSWAPHLWLPNPNAHRLDFARQLWDESLEAVGVSSY